jgi:RNA polymerase sigma-70 factor (ECF subfamily)
MPEGLPGLGGTLDYGRIRDTLLPLLLREGGMVAAHDPDGHLFVIRGSQNRSPRQL